MHKEVANSKLVQVDWPLKSRRWKPRLLTYRGETHTVVNWERLKGLSTGVISSRLVRGWSEEDTISYPQTVGGGLLKYQHNGKIRTAVEWARELGISDASFGSRVRRHPDDPRRVFAPPKSYEVTLDGESHTIVKWANKFGLSSSVVYSRIQRGWSLRDALALPVGKRSSSNITYDGKTQSATQWGKGLKCTGSCITHRIRRGWSIKEALTVPVQRGVVQLGSEKHTMRGWAHKIGVPVGALYARLNRGWSIEDVLMTPLGKKRREK